ncbi:hypothetical protein JW935_23495 [candidate division KSB1 bacterium]|nr:hypothetical protein [candidate division KSB1 bacterium]
MSGNIAFWDSLIITAARRAVCKTILTEELNAGQMIENVKIFNLFKA